MNLTYALYTLGEATVSNNTSESIKKNLQPNNKELNDINEFMERLERNEKIYKLQLKPIKKHYWLLYKDINNVLDKYFF